MRFIKLTNSTGLDFHLNLEQVTSFAYAPEEAKVNGIYMFVRAGGQDYHLDEQSTKQFLADFGVSNAIVGKYE